jgi:RNA recognition motif-containing protein
LKFKSAHVVQKRNGRSKGFGFAEFDSHDDQQKALQALNAKKVDERELIVKVALTEQQQQGETKQEGTTSENKQ